MRIDVNIKDHINTPPTTLYEGFRGLHYIEGGRWAPTGMPAVLPPIDVVALEMTKEIQLMSFALMKHFAPSITGAKWRAAHGAAVAMNNRAQNGFDEDEGGNVIPHADFVNNTDLTESLPRYDKMQRSFAGTFIRGTVVGNELICVPGVHGIDATKAMPSLETIIKNNWYVIACTSGSKIWNFPHGDGSPVVYPFIFNKPIRFPLEWFAPWKSDKLPNYLTVGGI